MWKFLADPVLIDDGCDLGLHKCPDSVQQGLIFLAYGRANVIKIAVDFWKCFLCNARHCSLRNSMDCTWRRPAGCAGGRSPWPEREVSSLPSLFPRLPR